MNTAHGPVVETRSGKVRGRKTGGAHAFKGIRYATAERFMAPQPVKPWAGIVDAYEFGAIAPQSDPAPPPGPPYVILAQLPKPINPPPPPVESEDCLFLNVWAPAVADGVRRPVMVSLHGGFFYGGSGNAVDGSVLAGRGDVVVVSLNHRLNAFGFCHLGDVAGEDFAHSGNAGMLDIIAGLEWVRENIEAFGGDPNRVMVFGTSGGGMKTSFLMASPRSSGLLHRAGVQSGPGLRFMERDTASQAVERLLFKLGLTPREADALRSIDQVRLLAAYHEVARELPPKRFIDLPGFAPVLDPEILPRHPFSPNAAPGAGDIPMLSGWASSEMSFFMGRDPEGFLLDEVGLAARLSNLFGERAEEVASLYRREFPVASPSERYIRAHTDLSIMLPTIAQAERAAAAGGGVWLYRLDLRSAVLGGKLGAVHTLETPLIFDTTERNPLTEGSDTASELAKRVSSAWVRFASDGDPSGPDLPAWPAYDQVDRATMLLGESPVVANDPGAERRACLAPLLEV